MANSGRIILESCGFGFLIPSLIPFADKDDIYETIKASHVVRRCVPVQR